MRAAPGPLVPGGVALLLRGISKTFWVSVREELVVAANDLPIYNVKKRNRQNARYRCTCIYYCKILLEESTSTCGANSAGRS